MASQPVSIGHLRWPCILAFRNEAPTFDETGITETIKPVATLHCAIEPMGLQTFLNSEQIDTPITHSIYFRWQPFANLEMFNVILRKIILPDGSTRLETYRIRRVGEWMGRHRYIRCDAELELYKT